MRRSLLTVAVLLAAFLARSFADGPPSIDKTADTSSRPDAVIILLREGSLGGEVARAADFVARRAGMDSEPLDPVMDEGAKKVGKVYLKEKMKDDKFFNDGGVALVFTKRGKDGKLYKIGEEFIDPPSATALTMADPKK